MVDQQLLERVTRLPRAEREEMFDALKYTLSDDEPDFTPELAAMLNGRLANYREHPETGIPATESVAMLRALVL